MTRRIERQIDELKVDELTFEVRRSPRRKTLELIIDRDGELVIAAPEGLDDAVMADFVREKRFWLYTKIAEKEARQHVVPKKEFVNGEGFPYLGRSYRLKLVDEQERALKLVNGHFCLRRKLANRGRDFFVSWYTAHGKIWLTKRVAEWSKHMGIKVKAVNVQDLGFRWGSCSASKVVNFHWATILLPAHIVDYVIVHELAHLIEPNHSPEFWAVVESAMFDFEEKKTWLAEHGHGLLI